MDVWTILSWTMSIIALTGTILNAERNICGFIFWLVSNIYMTIRFTYIGEYAQALLFLIYTLLAIRGIAVWQKKDKQLNTTRVDALRILKKIQKQADEWKAERRKEAEKIAEKEQKNKKL